jgi:hypothetical protein
MKMTYGFRTAVLLTVAGGAMGHATYATAQAALPSTYAAIFVEGTYTDKTASGSVSQAYQPEMVAIPEAGNPLPAGSSNETVSQSQQQVLGFTASDTLNNSTSSISTCYYGGGCIVSGSLSGNYVVLGQCVNVQGFNESFNVDQAYNEGVPQSTETLSVTASGSLNLNGVSVNPGNYEYGQKFPLSCVVQVVTNGSSSIQTLTGKVIIGDDIVNNDSAGNIVDDIIVAVHVTGTVSDGQGGTITIDERIGEVSVPNGLSSYSLTMSVFPQGGI